MREWRTEVTSYGRAWERVVGTLALYREMRNGTAEVGAQNRRRHARWWSLRKALRYLWRGSVWW